MSKIRVRFAPSPTGYLHIGGARTALYNYLFARHNQGEFILRIEDTDQARSTSESCQAILDGLKWLGIEWDEQVYYQSKRRDIYQKYAQQLLEAGKAYYSDDPEKGRAIVFKIPEGIKFTINDLIHGPIEFDSAYVGDVVMIKSDGFPAYNFACVVDDSEMGITHIIRGDDHVSNTPKQIALYEALGRPLPQFAHLPLIMGEDGTRLSKRHGHTSVMEYYELGFLPESLFNFLALLGWSPGDNTELMSKEEIIKRFTIERVKHNPAQFGLKKLTWMNSHYLKNLTEEAFIKLVRPFFAKAGYDMNNIADEQLMKLLGLYRERAKTLVEFVEATKFFFDQQVKYQPEAVEKFLNNPPAKEMLAEVLNGLKTVSDFNLQTLEELLRTIAKQRSLKFKDIAQPIRVSLTGTTVSPGIFETMELLGKDKVIERIEKAIKL